VRVLHLRPRVKVQPAACWQKFGGRGVSWWWVGNRGWWWVGNRGWPDPLLSFATFLARGFHVCSGKPGGVVGCRVYQQNNSKTGVSGQPGILGWLLCRCHAACGMSWHQMPAQCMSLPAVHSVRNSTAPVDHYARVAMLARSSACGMPHVLCMLPHRPLPCAALLQWSARVTFASPKLAAHVLQHHSRMVSWLVLPAAFQ